MCEMCDGKTESEVLLDLGQIIRRNGYVLQGIEGGHDGPSWVYTIGLVDLLDHPELIVVGPEAERAAAIITEAVALVEDGFPIGGGGVIRIGGVSFPAVDVHPQQFQTSVFAMWHTYYEAAGSAPDQPRAIQLLCPPSLFCQRHGADVAWLRLDEPATVLAYPRPARHVRRARGQLDRRQRTHRQQRPPTGRG